MRLLTMTSVTFYCIGNFPFQWLLFTICNVLFIKTGWINQKINIHSYLCSFNLNKIPSFTYLEVKINEDYKSTIALLWYFERGFSDGSHRILEGFVEGEDNFLKIVFNFSVIWIPDPNLPVMRVDTISNLNEETFYIVVA